MTDPMLSVDTEHLLRELAPQVLGTVVRRLHDFASAEDAVQEALLAAALQWPREGVPDNPRGWLIQVAMRRMTDQARSAATRRRREETAAREMASVAIPAAELGANEEKDDALILLFMCCHPSLSPSSAIALTLRAIGGLTTAEIAKAFFVPEATMAQRISRAKQSIKSSGVPFRLLSREQRSELLRTVLHVLYLIFNEGYASSSGAQIQRPELSKEAIRLTRMLHKSLSDESEVAGLLALMLLTDARRNARTNADGELIPLSKQDRTLWDRTEISEGAALVTSALSKGLIGPYQLQAAIAAVHDEAARSEDTDWPQVLALYDLLKRMSDNPMVALNYAVAAAMVYGPTKGLSLIEDLASDSRLANHHRLDAARAHLEEMAGNLEAATNHYRIAANRTTSIPERDYLLAQAARLSEKPPPSS